MKAVRNRISLVLVALAFTGCASASNFAHHGDLYSDLRDFSGATPDEVNALYGVGYDVATEEDAFLGRAMQAALWAAGAEASDQLPSTVAREVEALRLLQQHGADVLMQVGPGRYVRP